HFAGNWPAGKIASVAHDLDTSIQHLRCSKRADRPFDNDRPRGHAPRKPGPGITDDADRAAAHLGADIVEATASTLKGDAVDIGSGNQKAVADRHPVLAAGQLD